MPEFPSSTANASSLAESSLQLTCRRASWVCLFSAVAYTIALFTAVYLIQVGDFSDLSPLKLLRYLPQNIIIWKSTLLFAALANLSLLIFVAAIGETFERQLSFYKNIAIIICAMGTTCILIAIFTMMILFADISLLAHIYSDYLRTNISQLAWMILDQAISQAALIGNSLQAISGIIICYCIITSARYLRWVGWLALPVPICCLSVSVMTFIGLFQWALFLGVATVFMYVLWLLIIGFTLHAMGRVAAGKSS